LRPPAFLFFAVSGGGFVADLMGVLSPFATGDRNCAKERSLLGVARDGVRWALPKRPDSFALDVGVRVRLGLLREAEGRTLSRWV
jgi:hypothetical protein